jgi:hypothetical protein
MRQIFEDGGSIYYHALKVSAELAAKEGPSITFPLLSYINIV